MADRKHTSFADPELIPGAVEGSQGIELPSHIGDRPLVNLWRVGDREVVGVLREAAVAAHTARGRSGSHAASPEISILFELVEDILESGTGIYSGVVKGDAANLVISAEAQRYAIGCETSADEVSRFDYDLLVTRPVSEAVRLFSEAMIWVAARKLSSLGGDGSSHRRAAECLFNDSFLYRDFGQIGNLRKFLRSLFG